MRWFLLCLILAGSIHAQPSGAELAKQIEQLIDAEFSSDTVDPKTLSEVRQIFVDHGLPTISQVGQLAAEDYIVLATRQQPLAFLRQVLPQVDKAASTGSVSRNSGAFLRARVRQQEIEEALAAPTHPELRDQIEMLFAEDQPLRQNQNFDRKKMEEGDKQHETQEREIFAKYGVPTYKMVGTKAANDFVTLVEHQPSEFMRAVLPKLGQNVQSDQADLSKYATLSDRVLTDDHKPQRYGMNFVCALDGTLAPSPVEDSTRLDQRRAEIGLLPMRLYTQLVRKNSPQDYCKKER